MAKTQSILSSNTGISIGVVIVLLGLATNGGILWNKVANLSEDIVVVKEIYALRERVAVLEVRLGGKTPEGSKPSRATSP